MNAGYSQLHLTAGWNFLFAQFLPQSKLLIFKLHKIVVRHSKLQHKCFNGQSSSLRMHGDSIQVLMSTQSRMHKVQPAHHPSYSQVKIYELRFTTLFPVSLPTNDSNTYTSNIKRVLLVQPNNNLYNGVDLPEIRLLGISAYTS